MSGSPSTSHVKLEPVEEDPLDGLSAEPQDENDEYADDLDGDCCTICLQSFKDRTVIPECSHEFCFDCILTWIDQSSGRRCPLCTRAIESYLIHNIRSNFDYQKYHLPPLRSSPPPIQPLGANRRTRASRNQNQVKRWGRRVRREGVEGDNLERAIDRRRWVYQHHLYAKHVASNTWTRYRPCPTPAQFTASPDLISRATIFIRRELRIWVNLDVEFLTTYIVSLLKAIDIRSDSAIKLLSEFLDVEPEISEDGRRFPNAEHFAHELYSYLRSPCKSLPAYDANVQYDVPETSSREPKRARTRNVSPEYASLRDRKSPESDSGCPPSWLKDEDRVNPDRPYANHRRSGDGVASSSRSAHLFLDDTDDLELKRQGVLNSKRPAITSIPSPHNRSPSDHESTSQRDPGHQVSEQASSNWKGKGRAMVPDCSEPIGGNVTTTTRDGYQSALALGHIPPATSNSQRAISVSARQPNAIDDRNSIKFKPSQHIVSGISKHSDSDLPLSGNTELMGPAKQEISEELASAKSKVTSGATKIVRSRNPLLLAQAHLFQANNDVRNRGGAHSEPRSTDSCDKNVDRPSLLLRISDAFDTETINDISELGGNVTPSKSGPSSSKLSTTTSGESIPLERNGQDDLGQDVDEPDHPVTSSTGSNNMLESDLRAKLLRRVKSEKVPQTVVPTSKEAIVQEQSSLSAAAVDGSEGDEESRTVEAKLRSKARLRFKLASEKRLSLQKR